MAPSVIRNMNDYKFLVKCVVVGDSGVGKSCLLKRYVDGAFDHRFFSTIGVDFRIKHVDIDGSVVKIQLWDTAGQERFQTITSTYYRGAHTVAIVVDLSDRQSYDHIPKWCEQVFSYAPMGIPIVIIANKSDLGTKRVVSQEELTDMAERMQQRQQMTLEGNMKAAPIQVFETSALKGGESIDQAFEALSRQYIKNFTFGDLSGSAAAAKLKQRKSKLELSRSTSVFSEKYFKCCTIL